MLAPHPPQVSEHRVLGRLAQDPIYQIFHITTPDEPPNHPPQSLWGKLCDKNVKILTASSPAWSQRDSSEIRGSVDKEHVLGEV